MYSCLSDLRRGGGGKRRLGKGRGRHREVVHHRAPGRRQRRLRHPREQDRGLSQADVRGLQGVREPRQAALVHDECINKVLKAVHHNPLNSLFYSTTNLTVAIYIQLQGDRMEHLQGRG